LDTHLVTALPISKRARCWEESDTLFIQLHVTWSVSVTSHEECHRRLHYDRKFQIFLFLIGYINVNKCVFCLIISYLWIKSYNILNYNNCLTDWPFPLNKGNNKITELRTILQRESQNS
jgi:hypothetical protein